MTLTYSDLARGQAFKVRVLPWGEALTLNFERGKPVPGQRGSNLPYDNWNIPTQTSKVEGIVTFSRPLASKYRQCSIDELLDVENPPLIFFPRRYFVHGTWISRDTHYSKETFFEFVESINTDNTWRGLPVEAIEGEVDFGDEVWVPFSLKTPNILCHGRVQQIQQHTNILGRVFRDLLVSDIEDTLISVGVPYTETTLFGNEDLIEYTKGTFNVFKAIKKSGRNFRWNYEPCKRCKSRVVHGTCPVCSK